MAHLHTQNILSSNQSQCSAVMLFYCKFSDVYLINCIVYVEIFYRMEILSKF